MLSRRVALVFVGALGAALSLVLVSSSAREPQRTPLVARAARGEPLAIPLEGRESTRGSRLFRLELSLVDGAAISAHDELWLFLSSATTRRRVVSAELRLRGTPCALVATAGHELRDGQPTVFARTPGCLARTAPGALDLAVEVKGDGALSLLGFLPQPDAAGGLLQVPASGARHRALDVRGHFVWYPPTAARLVLLNQMWRLPPSSGLLLALVCAGVTLALAGCLVFPTGVSAEPGATRRGALLRAGGGGALLAGSLSLLYAAVAPPLSGPDEPYHLLGFADLVRDPALAHDTVVWMGETHLWRIRQQPNERFRTIDLGHPFVEDDPGLRATEVAMRSAVLARLWRALGPPLAGLRAPGVLLALRLVNVLVFALVVGGAAAFAVATVSEPFPQWVALPFLFVPSLPYFAMHVSETALLCSIYVLLATGVAVLFLDGPRAEWAGLAIGAGTGLMLAAGRSPWPLVGLVGMVLVGRILLGPGAAIGARRSAAVFWGGLAVGALLFFAFQDEAYGAMTSSWARHFATSIPAWLRSGGEWLRGRPIAVAAAITMGAALELAFSRPRAWLAERLATPARGVLRPAAWCVAGFVSLSFAGSLFLTYPVLPLAPPAPLAASERVAAVLGSMATMFRLTQPDFLLASSFWVGFGWLDTMPGPAFQALLVILVALALVTLVVATARRLNTRRFLWLLGVGAGAAFALVLYALATQVVPIALGGRYLVGWYLPVLSVIGTALSLGPRTLLPNGPHNAGAVRAALLLALVGPLHVYCLCFILRRYF